MHEVPLTSKPGQETPEAKKERLLPIFKNSQEVFKNPERPLAEGAIAVKREHLGKTEHLSGLIVLNISDDGLELGSIEEDGEIGASAEMGWDEIIDAQ